MESQPSDVREAIRATLAAVDTAESLGRHADLAAVFLVGGVLETGGHVLRGRAAIQADAERRRWRPRVAGSPHGPVLRQLTTAQIELVSPTEAHCRSRFVATTVTGVDHTGHYTDVVRLVGGRWQIAHRRVTVDGAATTSPVRGSVRRGRTAPLVARPPVAGPSVVARKARSAR